MGSKGLESFRHPDVSTLGFQGNRSRTVDGKKGEDETDNDLSGEK